MPMNNIRGPLIYDSLDKTNADKIPQKQASSNYLWIPVVVFIALVFLFIAVWALLGRLDWIIQNTYDPSERSVALWLSYIIPLSLIGLVIVTGLGAARYVWLRSERLKLISHWHETGTIDQLQRGTYEQRIIEGTLDAILERARQSQYQGISTLTLDQSRQITNSIDDEEDDEIEAQEAHTEQLPTLMELRKQNLINRSGTGVLLGFFEENTP